MPGSLTFSIVFMAVALLALLAKFWIASDPNNKEAVATRRVLNLTALGLGVISFLMLIAASYNPVSTKNEGIETTFGATSGHLSNGFHMTWPWVKVHEMDAAIQTDTYSHEKDAQVGASHSGPCISTRIANQQLACVDISLRWRIRPNSSDELYRDYRAFDHVRNSLVTRDLKAAVNDQFARYNPLDSISTEVPSGGARNPSLAQLGNRIKAQMTKEIGGRISVLSAIVSLITYDDETQARINQLQQQIAQTRIAEQERTTNTKQAAANAALAASVKTSPNVLVAQCMNVLSAIVKAGHVPPPGFSCWPGGSATPVIAQAR